MLHQNHAFPLLQTKRVFRVDAKIYFSHDGYAPANPFTDKAAVYSNSAISMVIRRLPIWWTLLYCKTNSINCLNIDVFYVHTIHFGA